MAEAVCRIKDCDRYGGRKGLCSLHYQQLNRKQRKAPKTTDIVDDQCSIDCCCNVKNKGQYCGSHRARKERYGDPLFIPKPKGSKTDVPGYTSWQQARYRCLDPNSKDYKRYGAKGIKIDERWANSFEAFYKDMGPRPHGTSLDRIDNNGDYTKDNCRWANARVQANNRTVTKRYMFDGVLLTIGEISTKTAVSYGLIKNRLRRGWTIEEAVKYRPGETRST